MFSTTDYDGSYIYQNDTLKMVLLPEGYWQKGSYYYYLKDHLGSNRVVVKNDGTVVETSSYYPSGMRFGESVAAANNSVQPYRHTGHEMQEMHGLNWIDNGARFRSVSIPEFATSLDPLAEKYYSISPYAYCMDNPIRLIDPDGMDIHLRFESDEAKNAYLNTVNQSLGSFYTASVNKINDEDGYSNQVVLTPTSINGPMSETQKAFYSEYNSAVSSELIVKQKIVLNDKNTVVGSWVTGKVDMADVSAFDKAGKGGASSAGALIHETSEQLEKSKLGLCPNELGKTTTDASGNKTYVDFENSHSIATKSENKVNGNTRQEEAGYFLETDGTKTQQTITPTATGGVDIYKTKLP